MKREHWLDHPRPRPRTTSGCMKAPVWRGFMPDIQGGEGSSGYLMYFKYVGMYVYIYSTWARHTPDAACSSDSTSPAGTCHRPPLPKFQCQATGIVVGPRDIYCWRRRSRAPTLGWHNGTLEWESPKDGRYVRSTVATQAGFSRLALRRKPPHEGCLDFRYRACSVT